MLGNLWNSAKRSLSNVWNELKDRGSTILTGTHYTGPYNKLTPEYIASHPPTDRVDEGALFHDLDYQRIAKHRDSGKISQREAKDLIRESDERFLANTSKNFRENPWAAGLGYLGIKGKTIAEDYLGLDPHKFVTAKFGMLVDKPMLMPVNRGKFGFGQERVNPTV